MIVCAGGLRTDYLITREGRAHNDLPGGNALFAAAGARLWCAEEVALWARCGANYPRAWLASLADLGLETSGLVLLGEPADHRTFFAYTAGGRRDDTDPAAHYARIGQPLPPALRGYVHSTPRQDEAGAFEPLALRPQDWPPAYGQADAVHLAPLPLATHLHVPAALRARGVRLISLDPGERYMIPRCATAVRALLPQVDVFLPSDQEVRSFFGEGVDPWEAAETFAAWGAPLVVVKAGAAGVYLLDAEQGLRRRLRAYHQADDTRVVDVTGAGDSFCGGFLAGLQQTGDPIRAAQMGLVSASLVIEGYGALYALGLERETAVGRLAAYQQPTASNETGAE